MSAEAVRGPRDFATFFECAYPRILAQAIILCGSREDAEDAVQEAFVEAYRSWDRIADYDLPEAWVHRATVQRLWKAYRKRKTGQDRLLRLPVPEQSSTERTAEAREVLGLLAGLPPRQRITMVLFCLHGWSQQEVAAALRMTRGGVAANVSKARQTLREALGMAAGETGGRDELVSKMRRVPIELAGAGRDPLVRALRNSEAWVRAAVESDPEMFAHARIELDRRLAQR